MSRILLVEDSRVQAIIIADWFEKAGHTVKHVVNVEEAIKACYEQTPDLVVSDQELGEISGMELCRRIKSDLALSMLPVLMLTGSQVDKYHVAALDSGADAFLSKESSREDVLAVVNRLLHSGEASGSHEEMQKEIREATHRSRFLVLDDSRTFRTAVSDKLAEAGFDVAPAGTGNEALALLEDDTFDVVLTDLEMPEMNGLEFTRKAREWSLEKKRQLGILLMTGSERTDVLVQALDAGADDYLNKTQDVEVIVAHATALARRVARTRQVESLHEKRMKKELALREAELKREQAEERAKLADELARANEALAESNEQLKSFAYVASHDLQAPLRRVISFCELLEQLEKDNLSEKSFEFIRFIVSSAKGMQQLITDLLAYSRVQTSEQPREATDCNKVFDEVLTNLEVVIGETNATVTRDELPTLPAYRTQLMQLLQNLISNAINYRSDAPPKIHLSAERQRDNWLFRVSDNGLGIEEKYREQIFQMFKRLHGSERAGTGIGLATCKKIVERHGGQLGVDSEKGVGSTFHFTISDSAS